ncbi:MAG: hypothetical protein WHS38_04715 [Thermodesulforhabdaceae bacterium]
MVEAGLSKIFSFIRRLRMILELVVVDLFKKGKRSLSVFSSVPEPWQSRWHDVKEDDERLLWSSVAFSHRVPSVAPYTKGWLIISDRGLYFACKGRAGIKLAFRRWSPPLWMWTNHGKKTALCSFFFNSEDEWSIFLPNMEDLFRSRLFHFEMKGKKCFKSQRQK